MHAIRDLFRHSLFPTCTNDPIMFSTRGTSVTLAYVCATQTRKHGAHGNASGVTH